ncbi:MAG TPA: cysteine--1-D-myo-inosityl 2-amino-2-deoxy-alpha-D-glucopyranoside ligase, partial [Actinomycetales bacterium]|nr:cysteine--1-D-myo-inosityl 2-amino-2-deoxy-alpha-D-glucopyranoside ligase [Actinomycetales bacterium]
MAGHYVHAGMIGLDGTKMSKSLGNLVFVSKLVEAGTDPSAIRLGVFAGHYRSDRDWSDDVLADATRRLDRWRHAARVASG